MQAIRLCGSRVRRVTIYRSRPIVCVLVVDHGPHVIVLDQCMIYNDHKRSYMIK